MKIISNWFNINCLQLNPEKCHFKVLGLKSKEKIVSTKIDEITVFASSTEVLLGITVGIQNLHLKDILAYYVRKLVTNYVLYQDNVI